MHAWTRPTCLVSAGGDQAITSVLEQFTPVLRRVERLRFSSLSGRASPAQHTQIIELCAAGDTEGAAAATRENWLTLAPLLDTTPLAGAPDEEPGQH